MPLQTAFATGGPLSSLGDYPQFLLWKISEVSGTRTKVPVDPATLQVCNAHDSKLWVSAQEAITKVDATHGLAFVFTEADPFFFLDIDHALIGKDWSDLSKALLARFPGAAVEVSQSRAGLHVIGKATQTPVHAMKNIKVGIELYTEKRFIALTGLSALGDAGTDHTQAR